MRCMYCNSEIPSYGTFCPVCGAQNAETMNDQQQIPAVQPGYYFQPQPVYQPANGQFVDMAYAGNDVKKNKTKKKVAIGIVVGVCFIVGMIVLLLALGVFDSKNGTYAMSDGDETVEIVLKNEKGTISISAGKEKKSTEVSVLYEENELILSTQKGDIRCTYDNDRKTVVVKKNDLIKNGLIPYSLDGTYEYWYSSVGENKYYAVDGSQWETSPQYRIVINGNSMAIIYSDKIQEELRIKLREGTTLYTERVEATFGGEDDFQFVYDSDNGTIKSGTEDNYMLFRKVVDEESMEYILEKKN